MHNTKRSIRALAVLAVIGGLALGAGPTASATGTPNMNITASGGDGTTVDNDGTQGSFTDSVQGAADTDGDQDARDLTPSEMATDGMTKSPNKMTK